MQDKQPLAFESKKLSNVERQWPTHDTKTWAIVHYLKLWQSYLGLEQGRTTITFETIPSVPSSVPSASSRLNNKKQLFLI